MSSLLVCYPRDDETAGLMAGGAGRIASISAGLAVNGHGSAGSCRVHGADRRPRPPKRKIAVRVLVV